MTRFVVGDDRSQSTLFPERVKDYLSEDNPVRAIDVLAMSLIWPGGRVSEVRSNPGENAPSPPVIDSHQRCQMRSVAGCYRFQPTERYEFAAAAKDAVLWCGSLNFFILLTSSLTIVLAINAAAQDERPNRMIRWLVVTLVLGAAFLGVKGYEYHLDFQDKVVPILDFEVKLGDGSAGELFWISTGSQRHCTPSISPSELDSCSTALAPYGGLK